MSCWVEPLNNQRFNRLPAFLPINQSSIYCPSLWPTRLAVGLELEVFVVCAIRAANDSPRMGGSPVCSHSATSAFIQFSNGCDVTPRHTAKQHTSNFFFSTADPLSSLTWGKGFFYFFIPCEIQLTLPTSKRTQVNHRRERSVVGRDLFRPGVTLHA